MSEVKQKKASNLERLRSLEILVIKVQSLIRSFESFRYADPP